MFKKLLNKKLVKNEKGLTLIELLAVIVILAIIAAIAVPAIGNIIENSRIKAVKADAINILNAANIYLTEQPDVTTFDEKDKGFEDYLQSKGKINKFTIDKEASLIRINADVSLQNGTTINFINAELSKIDASSAESDEGAVTVNKKSGTGKDPDPDKDTD